MENSILECQDVQSYLTRTDCREKTPRHPTSLSYLIPRDLSQSACIRIGIVMEDILNLYLVQLLIRLMYERRETKKNVKGKRQKDILFINDVIRHVLYAEVKANINLDTQKTPSVVDSVDQVIDEYRSQGMKIDGYVISLRYLQTSDIPRHFVKKYKDVQLIGIRDFIETVLHLEVPRELQSYEAYSSFLMRIANHVERE